MKLYSHSGAPNPRRVRVYLAEKGIVVPTVEVDLRAGEHLGDEFRNKSPWCVVPVLELDDGTCIGESVAICRYFEALRPEPPLFGSTPAEVGVVEMWNRLVEHEGLFAAVEAIRNSFKGFIGRALAGPVDHEQLPQLAERGRARTLHFFDLLDSRLGETEFVAGDTYSVADITAMITVDFAGWMKMGLADEHANARRWFEQVSSRPSAQA